MQEKLFNHDIKLERLKVSDSKELYQAIKSSYSEISLWLDWLTPTYTISSAEDFIYLQINNWTNELEYTFAIRNNTGDFLGVISLHLFDKQNDVASIGYWMNSDFTGKGYCTQALKLIVANALKTLDLIRIEVIVANENRASQKVAEKAGTQFESLQKNRLRIKGLPIDAKMYVFTNG
jgi:ribosomal-protein-serine acetyltransferase